MNPSVTMTEQSARCEQPVKLTIVVAARPDLFMQDMPVTSTTWLNGVREISSQLLHDRLGHGTLPCPTQINTDRTWEMRTNSPDTRECAPIGNGSIQS